MSKQDGYTVASLCRLLDIKRPSYYKWLNREETLLDLENIEIADHIKAVVANVGRIHGYRMMSALVSKKMAKKLNLNLIK